MTERIIDFADEPARLSVKYDQLVIERGEKKKLTMPIEELAVIVVSNPQVSFTQSVLSSIAQKGGAFVTCDQKHMPIGMMLPLVGHFVQGERFAIQANAPLPLKKRLWQQIIKAKVKEQGKLLKTLHGKDYGLIHMAEKVKSGDSDNIEAQASKKYWPLLFASKEKSGQKTPFRRDRNADDQNKHLNYGYAILRATVARAVCAAGLHPSLGIYHHNRYDAFCLADDLMEPFRPMVDYAVAKWIKNNDPKEPLDKNAKAALIKPFTERFNLDGEQRTFFDVASRTASSLAQVFMGKRKSIILPEISYEQEKNHKEQSA